MADLNEFLKKKREKKGKTQQEIADLLGVHLRTYQRYEEDHVPPYKKLGALASILDFNVTDAIHFTTANNDAISLKKIPVIMEKVPDSSQEKHLQIKKLREIWGFSKSFFSKISGISEHRLTRLEEGEAALETTEASTLEIISNRLRDINEFEIPRELWEELFQSLHYGLKVKKCREGQGLTRKEFASKVGMSEETIKNIEELGALVDGRVDGNARKALSFCGIEIQEDSRQSSEQSALGIKPKGQIDLFSDALLRQERDYYKEKYYQQLEEKNQMLNSQVHRLKDSYIRIAAMIGKLLDDSKESGRENKDFYKELEDYLMIITNELDHTYYTMKEMKSDFNKSSHEPF